MKISINQLRKIIREEIQKNLTESNFKVGDYVRDVDRDMPTSWDSPDPQDVHDEFLMLRDENGEVPLKVLANGLGVEPNKIDWSGTGLRVINGIVTELIGDTPYRTDL